MQKWEYLFVTCSTTMMSNDWKPWLVNGRQPPDWKKQTIYEYSNKIGEEGWELVNLMTGHHSTGDTKHYRLVFKRPKP